MLESTKNIYEEQLADSPSEKCRQILNLSFKRADDWHFVFYDDFEGCLAGGFTLNVGNLSFFNEYENSLHTLKLHQVFVANEYRGNGWFKMFMETILSAADMSGVFLYLCARPYKLNMPTIRHPQDYIDWIHSEDHYMAMHKDGHYERQQARKLKQAYMKLGLLPLELNNSDVSKQFWKDQYLCNNPQNCCDDVKEALEDRVKYNIEDDTERREQLTQRHSNRKREQRKNKRKHQRNHKRCA